MRAARPEDDRIIGDPQAAGRLAGVCGGLPLALQITAALLKADPALSAAELADQLAGEQEPADGVCAMTTAAGRPHRRSRRRSSCPTASSMTTTARMFRLLAVNPGPDISTAAAVALADLPVIRVRAVLGGLAQAHLAETAPGTAGRWRMHDLLRLYAGRVSDEHAGADDREQARDRLLGYYLRTAEAANAHLRALPGTAVPDTFTGRDDALAWLDAERASLVAAVGMAADTGRDQAAMDLALALAEYFEWRRRFDDWLATAAISLDAARRLSDRHREAAALINLAGALNWLQRFEEVITACQDAAAIYREIGDRHGEADALFASAYASARCGGLRRPYRVPGRRRHLPRDRRPEP